MTGRDVLRGAQRQKSLSMVPAYLAQKDPLRVVCLAQAKTGSSPGGQGKGVQDSLWVSTSFGRIRDVSGLSGLNCALVHLTRPAPKRRPVPVWS